MKAVVENIQRFAAEIENNHSLSQNRLICKKNLVRSLEDNSNG